MRWQRPNGETTPAKQRHVLLGASLAVLIAALLVAWLLIDDESSSDATAPTEAEIVSVAALRKAADAQDTPIYWAGQTAGTALELSQPAPDRTYVRYLPTGVEAGDPKPFLTVSSYSFEDPIAALRTRGQAPGGVLATAPGDGTVYFDREDPKSVYLAYPETEVEIEVFAPEFKEALELATSGHIVPVD